MEHSKLFGFQVADAVASGLHYALKLNQYGETEGGYDPHLKGIFYRHKGMLMGYGLKVWPEDLQSIKSKAPEVSYLEGSWKFGS